MPTEQEKADLSKRRGQVAASITDPEARRKFIAEQGDKEAKDKLSDSVYAKLSKDADDTEATGGKNKDTGASAPIASYKNGTDYVPKTGNYKLHEGEKVTPADENPANTESVNHSPEEKAHFSRALHKLHKGALHEHLGIPQDQSIPMEKKEEAAKSDNKHVAAMGRLAVAMHGFKH
jgi:hypothetical protein